MVYSIMELWTPCIFQETLFPRYEVSSLGRVRRLWTHKSHTILSPSLNRDGYYYVQISLKKGKRITASVHKLIITSFLGPIPDGHEINHKDGVKIHNSLENLQVVTPQENMDHAIANHLLPPGYALGEKNPRAKLTEADVLEIRTRYTQGEDINDIWKSYPQVTRTPIYQICRGQTWTHLL